MRSVAKETGQASMGRNSPKSSSLAPVSVRFKFTHPTAVNVFIAGTFNDWEPKAELMHSSGDGDWWGELPLVPGEYEYSFIVDGEWVADPLACENQANPFGGRNSIVRVAGSALVTHIREGVVAPLKNATQRT